MADQRMSCICWTGVSGLMRRLGYGLGAFWLCTAWAAQAQEVCVVCTGPAAVYRCTVEKSEKLARFGAVGDKAVQQVCIKELARQSGHATCAVRRDTDTAVCNGVPRMIPLASLLAEPPAAPPPPAKAPPAGAAKPEVKIATPPPVAPAPGTAAAPPAAKDGPPRTVEEMAKRTGEKSKEQLKDAGNAATRTWHCLSSLFTNC